MSYKTRGYKRRMRSILLIVGLSLVCIGVAGFLIWLMLPSKNASFAISTRTGSVVVDALCGERLVWDLPAGRIGPRSALPGAAPPREGNVTLVLMAGARARIEAKDSNLLNATVEPVDAISLGCEAKVPPFQVMLDDKILADDPLGFHYVATSPVGGDKLPSFLLPLSGHVVLGQTVQHGAGWVTRASGILESGSVTLRVVPWGSDQRVTLEEEQLDPGSLLDTHACLVQSAGTPEVPSCQLRGEPGAIGFLRSIPKEGLLVQLYARGPVGLLPYGSTEQRRLTIPNSTAAWRSDIVRVWGSFIILLAGLLGVVPKLKSEVFEPFWNWYTGKKAKVQDDKSEVSASGIGSTDVAVEEGIVDTKGGAARENSASSMPHQKAVLFVGLLAGMALMIAANSVYAEPVEIHQGSLIGGGYSFRRGATCLVVTAQHVVKEMGVPVTVLDRTSAKAVGNRNYVNESYDLALIELAENSSVACTTTWPDVAWLRSAKFSAASEFRAIRHYGGGQEVVIRLKHAGGDKDHITLAPVDKLTIRESDSGAIVELDGRPVGIVLSIDTGTDRVTVLRFDWIDELVGERFRGGSGNGTLSSAPPQASSKLEQLRSRALILGFDGAMAVAHATMGRKIDQEVAQQNAYLKRLDLVNTTFPLDPLGVNRKGEPFFAFAGKVMSELGAVDRRIQLAFVVGWAGVFLTNTPALKPPGFDLRKVADEAGLPARPRMTDTEYVQWLADEARKSITVERGSE